MDVDQSDTEAKFKSATTASNWKDTKSTTASVDPTAPSLSSSSSSSSLLGDTSAPGASGVIKNESSDSRTQISGAGGSMVTATNDEQLCSGSKNQVSINNVNNACVTTLSSSSSSSATAGAAPSLAGDAKTDAVDIKEEMDCDSPMPSLPAHAVSKHMVSEI